MIIENFAQMQCLRASYVLVGKAQKQHLHVLSVSTAQDWDLGSASQTVKSARSTNMMFN